MLSVVVIALLSLLHIAYGCVLDAPAPCFKSSAAELVMDCEDALTVSSRGSEEKQQLCDQTSHYSRVVMMGEASKTLQII